MRIRLEAFEEICRRAHVVDESGSNLENSHVFEKRNLFPNFPKKVKRLFDDGHYSEATFEALKFLDKRVQLVAGSRESGFKLMMNVFGGEKPKLKLTELADESQIDEQKGYQFMFAGIMSAIRNPKGHEYSIDDDLDTCLDHLTIISALLRRLEEAGYDMTQNK